MRKVLSLLLLLTLALLIALPHAVLAHKVNQESDENHESHHGHHEVVASFHIRLTGDQQVKPVSTDAFGFASVRLIDNSSIEFRVVVCDIANVTLSHIHAGATGTNGPIVIHFFDQPSSPVSTTEGCHTLAHGTRTPSDLVVHPEAGISNWNDFVQALLAGNTYVNVHTLAHPLGEIRGQLVTEHEQDDDEGDD